MPNWIENILRGRMGTANTIAIILTLGYVFVTAYMVVVTKDKAAIDNYTQIVMVVVTNVLVIKGIQTNTEK